MEYIPQFEPLLGEEEKQAIIRCIDNNWITAGSCVKELEKRIAELHQVKHAIACSNGTVALYMALKALGIGEGDEVIVPDFTFIASANAVVMAGGTPVFVDINETTLTLEPEKLQEKCTIRTKAVMPVHIYGRPAEMIAIEEITDRNSVMIVEDAAQGVGVCFADIPVGRIGDVGILSFYADKTITTGEGGMVLTNDDGIAEKCIRLSHQGNMGKGKYIHDTIGFNFRMTDIQAAIGLAQLDKLDYIITSKRRNQALYYELLAGVPGITLIQENPDDFSVPFRIVIFVNEPVELAKYLKDQNIGTNRVFHPLHSQPCYKYLGYSDKNFPNSIWAYEHGLALPSSANLTREQIEYICDAINTFQRHDHIKQNI